MNLDSKTQAVIAIGCATTANCTGCLEKTVGIAKELGISEEEIGAAIEVGRRVRAGAANKLDQFAATVNSATAQQLNPHRPRTEDVPFIASSSRLVTRGDMNAVRKEEPVRSARLQTPSTRTAPGPSQTGAHPNGSHHSDRTSWKLQ